MTSISSLSTDQILEVLSLSKYATAIYTSQNIVIEAANDAMIAFWGKDRSVIGKPLEEAVPELKGQPFKKMLQDVLNTGIANIGNAVKAELVVDGKRQTFYYDYQYLPIKNAAGQTYCILHTASDVTERELNRIALQKANELELKRQQALKESEERFRLLVEQAPVAITVLRTSDLIVDIVNDKMLEIWGKTSQIKGKPLAIAMPELEGQPFIGILKNVLLTGEVYYGKESKAHIVRNGKTVQGYFDFICQPVKDENGNIVSVLQVVTEVTEQVKTIELLRVSQQNLRNMVLQAPVGMCIVKGEPLMVEEVNDLFLNIISKPREPFNTKPYWDVNAEWAPYYEPITSHVLKTGETYYDNEHEIVLMHNGESEQLHIDFVYEPIKNTNGTVDAIMIMAIDVTDKVLARKKIEESELEQQSLNEELAAANEEMTATNEELASTNEELVTTNNQLEETQLQVRQTLDDLATSENRLSSMVASAPFPIGVYVGREMRILFANQSILDVWGKGNDVIGKLYPDILPELVNSGIFEQLDDVYTTGRAYHARNQQVDIVIDGVLQAFYFNYSFTPLYNAAGEIYGVMNTAAEVTDLVSAKQQVEQSEKNLTSIILQSPVAMCILLGPDHVIEIANQAMIKLWGKPENTVMKKPIFDALPDARDQGLESLLRNVYNTGETFEANEMPVSLLRHGVLENVYQNFVYQPYYSAAGKIIGVITISIDVTEQVKARKKIERAEESLRMATESAEMATWYFNADKDEFIISPRFNEIFGFEPDKDVSYNMAFSQIDEEYRSTVIDAIESSFTTGSTFSVEYPITSYSRGKKMWVRSAGKLVDDAGGNSYMTGVLIDITEQKRDEIRKNDFIGMVSHELKTPLTSLSAIVQVAGQKLKNSDDRFLSGAMEKANMQVKRMSNMINGFLNISRLESGKITIEKQKFDLDDLLNEMINELKLTVTTHAINLSYCDKIEVYADRDKISSVISNLLTNAVKYSPKGKLIDVRCKAETDKVIVSVKDEGMGIKPQDIDKIFTRYYRVETNHTQHISGFGIGLYLTAEIVERHNGKIGVESESGVGSTFWFTLPL